MARNDKANGGRGGRRIGGRGVLALLLVVGLVGALAVLEGRSAERVEEDVLAEHGWTVTGGAAPGYVEDAACAGCHRDLYRSYQEVGMARSFYRPSAETMIEDFGTPFHHARSRRTYVMERRGDELVFRRYQLTADGQRINEIEQEVDWVLGSGNHSRTYLYRTPAGELYLLPLAWYESPGRWGMAPGFDAEKHLGVTRLVMRECMACHNAYPDVPAGSDVGDAVHFFPAELPQGIGCQRCHGPGAEHVRRALEGELSGKALAATIVNPGKLAPERRDDVCHSCHLQPTVTISRVRRFDRGSYSFTPGEDLAAHRVEVDVVEPERERGDRFEINHHPYRLEQSTCFLESAGELSCLTCHDPHRKVPAAERAAHYRQACLSCHQLDDCALEAMQDEAHAVDAGDCAGCHMPKRRTEDVVQVVMTDHRIQRHPGGPELLAPRDEREPMVEDLVFLYPERAPGGALGEIYRAVAVLRTTSYPAAVDHLEAKLAEAPQGSLEPYLALAKGQIGAGRAEAAEATAREVLARDPEHAPALDLLGVALAPQGRTEEAAAALRQALELEPRRVSARYNLGRVLLALGRFDEARAELTRAVELSPNLAHAWYFLGRLDAKSGRPAEAIASFRRALAVQPDFGEVYVALGEALVAAGDRAEAERVLRHGAEHTVDPAPVAAALEALLATPASAGG